MVHFEAREYDVVTGRWLTTDPIVNGWSPYSGMNNDPIYYVDPDGRCPKCPDPASDLDIWTTGTSMTLTSGAEYILVDPSLGRDGWVRNDGMLAEVVVTPSFGDKLISFGAGIVNPMVDVFSTLGSSVANGYSEAYYRYGKDESTVNAPHFNSYEMGNDFTFQSNSYLDQSTQRKTELITNTVSVVATIAGFGVNVPVSTNAVTNGVANFGIKTVTKTVVVKTVEKSLESTH